MAQLQKISVAKNLSKSKVIWDVVVIGGGPAGMMAAGTAAKNGARVLLLEKNSKVGEKLLITGGRRCNVTNAEFDTRTLLSRFSGPKRKDDQFLFSPFSQWNVQDTLDFFHARGMETKVEALQRVFPKSDRAQSVWDVLVEYMKEYGVTVRTKQIIKSFTVKDNQIQSLTLATGEEIRARNFILATGGKSHPETGSTGDGFSWLTEFGHTISESSAALVPITLKDAWAKELSGITLENIQLTLLEDGKKQRRVKGRLLLTHKGATGPTILNMSKEIGEMLTYAEVTIELDLFPGIVRETLSVQFHELLKKESNKKVKNVLGEFLSAASIPNALVAPLLALAEIEPDTFAHSLTREKRLALTELLKRLPLHVKGLQGLEKAIITSGGVALTEIDFKTMRSRLISNFFIVGDLLDLDRPSGGYSLQLCWTTGVVAGTSAGTNLAPS
jgi:predicted Rossmann fold flavoprotein